MNKYYLLKFKEDYGDEFDVPALNCFTEEQYNQWLELPCGVLKPERDKNNYILELCYIHAYLGNYCDGFNEMFYGYSQMKEMVGDIVTVDEVSEEFYNQFHKSKLNRLSLCNVFDIDSIDENINYNY
jgi:hypothetical protein